MVKSIEVLIIGIYGRVGSTIAEALLKYDNVKIKGMVRNLSSDT